jgi:HPt (histidine-containing phosphotransfer) domain-containing protein
MIDWNRVAELKEEVGVEDFDEVIELFLEEVDEVIERLTSHPDLTKLEEDLHFIKGSALNLGFDMLGKLCQTGEKAAANGQSASVDVGQIVTAYRNSIEEFNQPAAV